MPWEHTFAGPDGQQLMHDRLGNDGIPFAVLVGRDGKILASGMDLRGPALLTTIERVLREP